MASRKTAPSRAAWCLAVCCAISVSASNCLAELANELPDSPSTTAARNQSAAQQTEQKAEQTELKVDQNAAPSAAGSAPILAQVNAPQTGQNPPPSAQSQNQPATQQPVGTAAAGSVPTTGIAASQPAGAAIAPGKQRRVRSIVLKVGALIGAGVAVGTVAALTLGTSSKPPGAR